MMAVSNEAVFGETQTLAMLLEFLSRLDESSVKTKVIEEIKEEVEKYLKDVDAFASTHSGYLFETIKKSKELRKNILKSEETYKYYKSQFNEYKDDCAQLLIDNVFPLFGCLYYMYYECNIKCIAIKGSDWKTEKCDGSSGGQYLNKWLKDETGKTERMIKRGFQKGDLSKKTGNDLFPSRTSTDVLLYYKEAAQFQFALYYMLFLPENWNRGQSGHAVLFLEALCNKVTGSEGFFKDQKHDGLTIKDLKSSCQTLKTKISTLTTLSIIAPVALEYKTVKYEELLQREHFSEYIEWLEKNLEQLIDSLTEMRDDVDNWEEDALKTSKSFGPFLWGFTFSTRWDWNKKAELTGKLETALQQLTKALQNLRTALQPVSSIASTVGSVIGGLGGLGATAGAAYAGSGFLGPVAEGVGRFFKGLFF